MCSTSIEFQKEFISLNNKTLRLRGKLKNKVVKLAKLYPDVKITHQKKRTDE